MSNVRNVALFGRPMAGRGDREHHQAALGRRQASPLPHVAIDIGVDDGLQRRAELAGRRHPLLDIGFTEHRFAALQPPCI